jgi:hypothetical protein
MGLTNPSFIEVYTPGMVPGFFISLVYPTCKKQAYRRS